MFADVKYILCHDTDSNFAIRPIQHVKIFHWSNVNGYLYCKTQQYFFLSIFNIIKYVMAGLLVIDIFITR
jgi:hypothetical protein